MINTEGIQIKHIEHHIHESLEKKIQHTVIFNLLDFDLIYDQKSILTLSMFVSSLGKSILT